MPRPSKKQGPPEKYDEHAPRPVDKGGTKFLGEVPGWQVRDGRLFREVWFSSFREAMTFVNKVAEIAEKENHHPDMCISYNIVKLELYTHDIKGLSRKDFMLAEKISQIEPQL